MRQKRHFEIVGLVMAVLLTGYLGAYFLAADYLDAGNSTPKYWVQYRVGSIYLQRFAPFFEPARRIDDLCFRRRHGRVICWQTP
jgi:hypothetical protein